MWQRVRRLFRDEGGFLQFLPMIASLGSILGGAGKSASASRAQQNQLQAQKDQAEVSKYGIGQNAQMQQGQLDLQRQGFSEDARGNRAKQMAIADLLMGRQPTRVSVPGVPQAQISGGLQFGEAGKAGLAELYKQAMTKMLAGDQFQGGNILQAPRATPMQQSGLLEKILGIGGLLGGVAGAVGNNLPQRSAPNVPQIGLNAGFSGLPGADMGQPQMPDLPTATAGLDPRFFRNLFTG